MEILQGNVIRDEYYSVRECAEVLGVNPKTIRNRIESKKIPAIWHEQGKGLSCWLIPKDAIDTIIESSEVVSTVPIPMNIIDELKAIVRAENDNIRLELKELRQEVRQSQERLEKSLNDRDVKLMETIRTMQEVKQQPKSFWQKLFE